MRLFHLGLIALLAPGCGGSPAHDRAAVPPWALARDETNTIRRAASILAEADGYQRAYALRLLGVECRESGEDTLQDSLWLEWRIQHDSTEAWIDSLIHATIVAEP